MVKGLLEAVASNQEQTLRGYGPHEHQHARRRQVQRVPLTFRIMMEGSSGWVIPAKTGLYLARNVAVQMQSKARFHDGNQAVDQRRVIIGSRPNP